jgi:hypothetical protein
LQKEKLKINEDCDRLFKKANDSVIECAEEKPKPPEEEIVDKIIQAEELLNKSDEGKMILKYIIDNKIKIITDAELPEYIESAYIPERKEIWLPPSAKDWSPTYLALILGHETFHAKQFIDAKMARSVEMEKNAEFGSYVLYYEMLKAGVKELPDGYKFKEDYDKFKNYVKKQDYEGFAKFIEKKYADMRDDQIKELLEEKPKLLRPLYGWYYNNFDVQELRASETVKQQKDKFPSKILWLLDERFNIHTKRVDELKRTLQEYNYQVKLEKQWMELHKDEFKEAK